MPELGDREREYVHRCLKAVHDPTMPAIAAAIGLSEAEYVQQQADMLCGVIDAWMKGER